MKPSYFEDLRGLVCRIGKNYPGHYSHIRGLRLVEKGESLLDVGCGSGTTAEAIRDYFPDLEVKYKGVDFIAHRKDVFDEYFPELEFECQDSLNLKEEDNSWDVVWSRHVVEHCPSFEKPMDEYLRVARKKVICILFNDWHEREEHQINPIKGRDEKGNEIIYSEFNNYYSKPLILKYLESKKPKWNYKIIEKIGNQGKPMPNIQYFPPNDIIIYLYK